MQVITNLDVDRKALVELFKRHKVAALQPQIVTRTEVCNGLLCHREPELCFVVAGPQNLPELLKGNQLINAVLPSPKVYAA